MRDIILALDRFGDQALLLGRVGENRATRVLIKLQSILSQYPGAAASITVKQPDRTEYPAAVKQEDGILTWEITSADIGDKAGSGQAQITIQDADGTIIKTAIAYTRVGESLGDATAPAPDPVETWIDKAAGTLADVKRAGNAAQAVADEVQRRLDDGDFVGPQGPKGEPGKDGAVGPQGPKGEPGKDAVIDATLTKEGEAADAAATGKRLAEIEKAVAGKADKARQNILIGSETGNPVSVSDAFSAPLCGLTVYGKSTQDGTPSPDNPVPIVSAGDGGTITVTIGDGADERQTLTLQTPNGLRGIPVTSGGNYTDPGGQRWVCDEVDLEREVRVQRVKYLKFSDSAIFSREEASVGTVRFRTNIGGVMDAHKGHSTSSAMCSNLAIGSKGSTYGTLNVFTIANGYFYINIENITTLNELQQYLQQSPMTLNAILATPVETTLTPAELAAYKALTTYAPDTVVQASDGAGLKLDYQRDVNIVIKNLEDAIASMTTT